MTPSHPPSLPYTPWPCAPLSSFMLRNRMPGPYEDRVGPVVLTLLLCLSITVNFILKLIDILGDKEAAAPATPLSMKGGLGSGIKSGPVVTPAPLTGP